MIPGKAIPEIYASQLATKLATLKQEFEKFGLSEIEVFPSPPANFRMRAEFKVWQQNGVGAYAMYEPGKYKQPCIIEEFSIGSAAIQYLMPALMQRINASERLCRKLFQIEFLSATSGEILVTLVYHKPLDERWATEAKALQDLLNCKIVGRSRGQKLVPDTDYIYETFEVDYGDSVKRKFQYQQVEASFTQPNAAVCQSMLNWAVKYSKHLGGDLLELYCGNGNFTLPLASNFNKVLATEIAKTSVKSALHNIALNKVENIEVVRLSSEEFTQAINRERPFQRLSHINLDDYEFSTILVDPPRAGLDSATLELAKRFQNILYISCNPETLKANLEELCKTHEISRFALFDQFPYTEHMECGAVLRKK